MADYWGQLTDPASVYEGIYGEPLSTTSSTSLTYYGKGVQDFTGSDPFDSYSRDYKATARPASLANPTPQPSGGGTTYYPQSPGVEYGYNTSTGDYEVKRAGQAYTSVPGRSAASPKGGSAPSVANPLPSMPYGLKPFTGSDPFDAYKGDYAASAKPASLKSGGDVIKLTTEPMSEVSGQNTANSFGKPVRGPSGKTYYPSNTPMSGVRAPYDPKGADKYSGKIGQDNRGPLSQLLGLKTSGLGGLLGGLFGGMQQRQGLGALLGMVPGIGAAAAPPTPQFYSNGVANPDYRNYSPGQSEGGGVMPSSSYSGGFTDSLGGTYYDRHL